LSLSPWTIEALSALAGLLGDLAPRIQYRKDAARGPAGDPFLEWNFETDQLRMATIGLLSHAESLPILDADVLAEFRRLSADEDVDQERIAVPAANVVRRLEAS